MEATNSWTSTQAKAELDQLLEAAKTKGPQEIRDNRGSFTVRFNTPKSTESVTDFLSKGLPDG